MTILTQRILIPSGPAGIWAIVSDINKNPSWQTDCQSVSFLTSLRAGPRVRWRYSSPQGNDFVVETTAWYDGLGYEYTYIDGAPFRESKGRLRLQETPDGTVVSWTLNYELGGLLSSLRNALGIRRHYERLMIDSLKALYSQVRAAGPVSDYEYRSLMRDAPDYEARARYVPRHATSADEPISERLIIEPPIEEDDTRPTQSVTPVSEDAAAEPASEAEAESSPEPSPEPAAESAPTPEAAAAAITPAEESASKAEASTEEESVPPEAIGPETTAPEAPEPTTAEPAAVLASEEPDASTEDTHARFRPPEDSDSKPIVTVPSAAQPVTEPPTKPTDTEPTARPTETEPLVITGLDRFGPKIDTTDIDTREISIWEVFDVPRPSESQEIEPDEEIADDDDLALPDILIQPAVTPAATPLVRGVSAGAPLVVGYRLQARRSLISLRRRK